MYTNRSKIMSGNYTKLFLLFVLQVYKPSQHVNLNKEIKEKRHQDTNSNIESKVGYFFKNYPCPFISFLENTISIQAVLLINKIVSYDIVN